MTFPFRVGHQENCCIMEKWNDIAGYEGRYQVSNYGRVKSIDYRHTGKDGYLSPARQAGGYLRVTLQVNRIKRTYLVHRLVAAAFIPNPSFLPQVNHKDMNPANNRVENLEWCTQSYNNAYGNHVEKANLSRNIRCRCNADKPVNKYIGDRFIGFYRSISDASKTTGVRREQIRNCCHNKPHCKSAGGFIWRFANV